MFIPSLAIALVAPLAAVSAAPGRPAAFDFSTLGKVVADFEIDSDQLVLADKNPVPEQIKVPGRNPLYYCDTPKDDILEIYSVDLAPNPPLPGKPLGIVAHGKLKKAVEKGALVRIHVKYGLVTLLRQSLDLCDKIKDVDLECPLGPGDMVFAKQVDIPREVPPGKYFAEAEVVTKDDERVTCLQAKVEFHR